MDDERRAVNAPMTFTAENGEQDRWQPGDQFEVLGLYDSQLQQFSQDERVWVKRGNRTGWVKAGDLQSCTTVIPPLWSN